MELAGAHRNCRGKDYLPTLLRRVAGWPAAILNVKIMAACLVFVLSPASNAASTFTWGANGHPLGRPPHDWADLESQFATMQRYGLTTYRLDIPISDEYPDAADKLETIYLVAQKYNVTLYPTLSMPFTYHITSGCAASAHPLSEAGLEEQGYRCTYPFVLRFASRISHWELQNEVSLIPDVMRQGATGLVASDYDTPVGRQWAALMRGMSKAICDVRTRTGQPLLISVDTTETDFGLIPFLQAKGVSIDIFDYHYYPTVDQNPYKMPVIVDGWPTGGTVDQFAEMEKIGMPVVINEFNSGGLRSAPAPSEYDQLLSLKQHIDYYRRQTRANVVGLQYYELYDEYWLTGQTDFGLMKTPGQPKIQMFLAAVYACGKLAQEDKNALLASGVFTKRELNAALALCR